MSTHRRMTQKIGDLMATSAVAKVRTGITAEPTARTARRSEEPPLEMVEPSRPSAERKLKASQQTVQRFVPSH
jgi:hypothetical protein